MTVDTLRSGPVADSIRAHRLIAVLRNVPSSAQPGLAAALADAGVHAFELAFDAPTAEADLATLRASLATRRDGPFLLGAAMIFRRSQLEAARRADADFGTAPLLDPTIVETSVSEGLPFMPSVFTPTEVIAAWDAGATFVKLFPASAVGPSFVRELRGPFPAVQLVPAGGVDASTARAFLDAGAAALAIGTALVQGDAEARRAIVAAVAAAGER